MALGKQTVNEIDRDKKNVEKKTVCRFAGEDFPGFLICSGIKI